MKASMALLKGAGGFPPNENLAGLREAGGTTAPLIYPSTYLACTIDCAWYLELQPMGPTRTRLIHGALFPKDRLSRNDFEDVAKNYYKRWDITIEEDIVASERQPARPRLAVCVARPVFASRAAGAHDRQLDPRPRSRRLSAGR